MDFFARQDQARKKTKLLVFYFVVAVILIVALNYLVALVAFTGVQSHQHRNDRTSRRRRWSFGVRKFSSVRP